MYIDVYEFDQKTVKKRINSRAGQRVESDRETLKTCQGHPGTIIDQSNLVLANRGKGERMAPWLKVLGAGTGKVGELRVDMT